MESWVHKANFQTLIAWKQNTPRIYNQVTYSQELLYRKYSFKIKLDAYLEEELYDLLTYCIQNPDASDYSTKEDRIKEIGQELFSDGGVDALENMYFSIEHRIHEEISKDAKPYRPLWNGISNEWNY